MQSHILLGTAVDGEPPKPPKTRALPPPILVTLPRLPNFMGDLELRRFQALVPAQARWCDWKGALKQFLLSQSWRISSTPFPWVMMLAWFELSCNVQVVAGEMIPAILPVTRPATK
eukprot:8474200-Alexandrium_andersonii.AAC.1